MTDRGEVPAGPLVGSSVAMAQVRRQIAPAAATDAPLFLTGESGTGKDRLARAVHEASARGQGAFVTLNGSGVPDDILDRELYGPGGDSIARPYPSVPRYLQPALGGTLYLDDICRMSAALQARLVHLVRTGRIIDDAGTPRDFDARLIAATNTDLAEDLRTGRLRRDLYDLLSVVVIDLPPLRARNGDAGEIAAQAYPDLLARFGRDRAALPQATIARINGCAWPGNVRQLLNVLRRMALSPGHTHELPDDVVAESAHLPASDLPAALPGRSFAAIERRVILDAIQRHDGSVQKAADELELAASTIYRKLKGWQTG